MPLDRNAKRLLDLLGAVSGSLAMRSTPAGRRQAFGNLMRSAAGNRVAVGAVENASLPGPGGPLAIRVYTPRGAKACRSPGLLYFHGGGWVSGDLDTHEGICARLAEASNCRIVTVDYRLAPEHKFPCALEDGIAALNWLAANASDFDIDPHRLAIGGDSSGANLAAGVCQWAKRMGGPNLALQVMLCPVMDAIGDTESRRRFAQGYLLDKATLDDDLALYCPPGLDRSDPRLSPVRAAEFSGLPPAHIHTAEFDPVHDEGRAYANKLAAAGVAVMYRCHAGMIHNFYGMAGIIPAADIILRDVGAAIGRALNAHADGTGSSLPQAETPAKRTSPAD